MTIPQSGIVILSSEIATNFVTRNKYQVWASVETEREKAA